MGLMPFARQVYLVTGDRTAQALTIPSLLYRESRQATSSLRGARL